MSNEIEFNKTIYVTNKGHERKECEVLEILLSSTYLIEDKVVVNAIDKSEITLSDLRKIAKKANIPYPLFFTTPDFARKQLKREQELIEKSGISVSDEIKMTSRGYLRMRDIYLIIKDLAKKQRFLTKRLVAQPLKNTIVGVVARDIKLKSSVELVAAKVTESIDFKLENFRSGNKSEALAYLAFCLENKNVLVSYSSHNYMPQNLPKGMNLSGLCMRDKYYPLIFINTKDHEYDTDIGLAIFEPEGRQVLTMLALLVCLSMNKFEVSSFDEKTHNPNLKMAFKIAAEVLIPRIELNPYDGGGVQTLKTFANKFNVTPSMYLYRLLETGNIDSATARDLFEALKNAFKKPSGGRGVKHDHRKYLKYNGTLFSREVFMGEKRGVISSYESQIILFRKGRFGDRVLVENYRRAVTV
jgi:Zn-dependent peptidase ImmA (M78 family)